MDDDLKPARLRLTKERGEKRAITYAYIDITPETALKDGSPILLGWNGEAVTYSMLAWHTSYQEESQDSAMEAVRKAVAFAKQHGYQIVGLKPELEAALATETGGK